MVLAEKGAGEGLLPVDVLCGGKAVVYFRKCVMQFCPDVLGLSV